MSARLSRRGSLYIPSTVAAGPPVLVQSSGVVYSGEEANVLTVELDDPATAENILWAVYAVDKDSEDEGTPSTGPSGFAREVFTHSTNQALIMAWKVAAGGETSATLTLAAGNNLSGSDLWIGEYEADGPGAWEIKGSALSADSGNVSVKPTGTTGTLTPGAGYALAAWVVDSTDTEGSATYANDYVELGNPTASTSSHAGLWLAGREVTGGTTTSSTLTRGGGAVADTMAAGVVAFGRAA